MYRRTEGYDICMEAPEQLTPKDCRALISKHMLQMQKDYAQRGLQWSNDELSVPFAVGNGVMITLIEVYAIVQRDLNRETDAEMREWIVRFRRMLLVFSEPQEEEAIEER